MWHTKYIMMLNMEHHLKMVYWKGKKFWIGKFLDHPEIMTQGETIEELEENLKDAYRNMVFAHNGQAGAGFQVLRHTFPD